MGHDGFRIAQIVRDRDDPQTIQRGEGPTVVSFVTVFVILYVLVNLFIDLLYGLLDPRIRYV